MSDDVFVLGNAIERRDRITKSGAVKSRFVVVVKSEKLIVNMNAKALGKGPALAIVEYLRQQVLAINERAAPATLLARAVAKRALARGAPWAMKRYAGGRTGELVPDQTDRLFNDSERFAQTISANAKGDSWTINVAANRLSPETLDGKAGRGGIAALGAVWDRLKALVPAFNNPLEAWETLLVRNAIKESQRMMITKAKSETAELIIGIVEQVIAIAKAA